LEYHQKALVLSPQNPSTLSAIGFVHLITFNSSQAVNYFHKALGIRRDDTFSTTMLEQALELMLADLGPCDIDGENIPPPDEALLPPPSFPLKANATVSQTMLRNNITN
jgi:anaphase-promoting complex subunit 6